jgi:hypothetical protein
MANDELLESQVVKDTKAFDEWFSNNIENLTVKAKEIGLDLKLKEIMRLSWRKCSDYKNKEIKEHIEYIEALKKDIDQKQEKYEQVHQELQKVTNKLIQAEKNSKK